ncbi:MAG TPA: hypothetical protein VGQ39_02650 [Pyrinomonadaceae bacterium]|jgi:hypothetical protein|nr:hypothetical protein [Pyrinomonadaceae bacterium]
MANLTEDLEFRIQKQARLLGSFNIECIIVGGVAATLHGSEIPTTDLDVCYHRTPQNLERLANALQSVHARLRNAPEDIPFLLDAETLHRGLNFTFTTDIGSLDLLGEVRGIGYYEDVLEGALTYKLFGYSFRVMDIGKLIIAKRTAGRPKDLLVIPELEAIQELQLTSDQEQEQEQEQEP